MIGKIVDIKRYADNLDKYITNFNLEDYVNDNSIAKFKKLPKNQIGKGGIGSVYTIKMGLNEYVLKISEICRDTKSNLLEDLCNMAKTGNIMYRIPNTINNKMTLLAPNYITEFIVGVFVKTLKTYTPSYMDIVDFNYDKKTQTSYIIMEKLDKIKDFFEEDNLSDLYLMLFEIAQALYVGQKIGKYNHYDLHTGNIMRRKRNYKKTNTIYNLGNGKFLSTKALYDYVIIDYGHSRFETKNNIITPKLNFKINNKEILDYYNYNPHYDFTSFLISILQNTKSIEIKNRILYIIAEVFNLEDISYSEILCFVNMYLISVKWRPDVANLSTMWYPDLTINKNDIEYNVPKFRQSSLGEILILLSELLVESDPDNFELIDNLNISNTFEIYNDIPNDFIIDIHYDKYNIDLNESNKLIIGSDEIFSIDLITDINSEYYDYYSLDVPYSFTSPKISPETQYLHIATINTSAGKHYGYKFRFDCCRLDMRHHFQDNNIKSGIAINAGFFNIKGDFGPIGQFKNSKLLSTNQIPILYSKTYGIICIDNYGNLVIDTVNNKGYYNNVITCGPLLVYDGTIILDDTIYDEVVDNTYIYRCRTAKTNENNTNKVFSDGIPNCSTISPGELSHSSNPNPRSALAIKENIVYFILVEGRGERGYGMTHSQLAQICYNLGAEYAIGLDGGRSSQMVWKYENEEVVNLSNPIYKYSHPVGTVISYVKE